MAAVAVPGCSAGTCVFLEAVVLLCRSAGCRNVHLLLSAWLQVADPGFRTNDARGVGMVFGPDVTEVRAA